MYKLLIILLLFSSISSADSFELIGGGLTYHLFVDPSVSNNFSNKVGSDGKLIANPLLGIAYTQNNEVLYQTYRLFGGQNSVGEPMTGGMYSFGFIMDNWNMGLAAGGYIQDGSKFQEHGADLWMKTDFMPLIGFEFNRKWMISDYYFIKLNNLVSPVMVNSALSIGSNF